jgi:hypothetical protein
MARIVRPVRVPTAIFWLGALVAFAACGIEGETRKPATPVTPRKPPRPDPDALPAASGLPPERRAIQVVNGRERIVDADRARARGLTIVDLSDDWAPAIFADGSVGDKILPNHYRPIFTGLASDRGDGDGQPLRAGQKNYLELYGIPPALSVLQQRFLADGDRPCVGAIDRSKLLAVDSVTVWGSTTEKRELARAQGRLQKLEAARNEKALATLDELAAADPRLQREVAAHRRFEAERAAFTEAEKRLICEGLLDPARHASGVYDTAMRFAMLAFQQKNVVMAQGDITRSTLEAMARTPLENVFLALRRVLTERAAHAGGGLIEDGSIQPPPTFLGPSGQRLAVPNLIGDATAAVLARLGLENAADALEFFRRRRTEDFAWLKVAVRFPPLPPYYGPNMELQAEIDRGTIWYDFPFDARGQRLPQPRTRYPSFVLYVNWQGQRIPLVRWRTTIGGWRSELASDGQEYLRYKDSDVGKRVWKHIVAAPVWVPPAYSPLTSMVKEKWVNGAIERVTNYDEVGPGYLSAYGLVAGIHLQPRTRPGGGVVYQDFGIRTHGTFDYTSLLGRFSHGCHRLANNLAVRLFSFVVGHRPHRTLGQIALDFRRTFWWGGEVFDLRMPSRGFYFELDPPMPVETLEGDVKGQAHKPLTGYLRKPGVTYARAAPPSTGPISPENRAGGGAREGAEP